MLPLSPREQQSLQLSRSCGRIMLESGHQKAIFTWADWASAQYPELRWLHSSQGGAKMSAATAGKMKAEGMKAGVPDIFLDVPRGGYHGLRIELKSPAIAAVAGVSKRRPSGAISPEQRVWLDHYTSSGYQACMCLGWAHAVQVIQDYLNG